MASFFYSIILSPYTDQANIEAAIHVLDRTLTLHGPGPFQDIWNVQKRRREAADGLSIFSRQPSSLEVSEWMGPGSGLKSRKNTNAEAISESNSAVLPTYLPTGRLPGWNNIWDLIKAEFGLDSKPESKQYIALQELNIRMRIQDADAVQDLPPIEDETEEDKEPVIKEEREVRDEVGRAIVGLLIRVLEQDTVLRNGML